MRGLQNKAVVIAGGALGIGEATALRLAEEGARVLIGDIDIEAAMATAAKIEDAGGQAEAAWFDLEDEASVAALMEKAVATFGAIDGVFANAAAMPLIALDTDAVDVSNDVFDKTLAINLRGYLFCTRHAVPHLVERGGGSIVYTAANEAYTGADQRPAYAASKAGVLALMRHVASRWGKQGIRSNAVVPGLILSQRVLSNAPPALLKHYRSLVRSPRLGRPADIAAMAAMLLSDDSAWINGQAISVEGGLLFR